MDDLLIAESDVLDLDNRTRDRALDEVEYQRREEEQHLLAELDQLAWEERDAEERIRGWGWMP